MAAEVLQVASRSGPVGVAAEPLQPAEQHRLSRALGPYHLPTAMQNRSASACRGMTNGPRLVPARLAHHLAVKQPEQHRLAMATAAHLRLHLATKQAEERRWAMVPARWRNLQLPRSTMASAACMGRHPAVKQAERPRLAMAPCGEAY